MKKSILILSLLLFVVSSKVEIFTVDVDGSADFINILAAFGRVDVVCSAIQDRSQDSHCTQKVTQKF